MCAAFLCLELSLLYPHIGLALYGQNACCVCVCVRACVCVWERERVCIRIWMIYSFRPLRSVSERERECVCVCVCVWERVCVWVSERESVCVCERERESVYVCVRVRERERECVGTLRIVSLDRILHFTNTLIIIMIIIINWLQWWAGGRHWGPCPVPSFPSEISSVRTISWNLLVRSSLLGDSAANGESLAVRHPRVIFFFLNEPISNALALDVLHVWVGKWGLTGAWTCVCCVVLCII